MLPPRGADHLESADRARQTALGVGQTCQVPQQAMHRGDCPSTVPTQEITTGIAVMIHISERQGQKICSEGEIGCGSKVLTRSQSQKVPSNDGQCKGTEE